ncbi:MAG: POTRA domain-containing protein, partial [Ferruginibacter sp.]
MHRIYQNSFLIVVFFLSTQHLFAQNDSSSLKTDTVPVSINPALQDIFNSKASKVYTIAGITVLGSKSYDANLIISITGMAVGDKVQLPGSDVFSKAITKLWKQNLVSEVQINLTRLEESNLYVEIQLTERPRLLSFTFSGIKKGEKDDLEKKVELTKDRVLTENMKLSAVEVIRKFYYDKGFRNVQIEMKEEVLTGVNNAVALHFRIKKGNKVKINSINFTGNETIPDQKLKKQMKGTKEMGRFTLFPEKVISPYGDSTKPPTFKQYLNTASFLSPTRTGTYIEPYFRPKFFNGSKFSDKKYAEDKEKVLDYYNSQGFRDAQIVADTSFTN